MKVEPRNLQNIELRHLAFKGGPPGDCVVWWYGAVIENKRERHLPHVTVQFKKLFPDGSFGTGFRRDFGITDLGLLQVGSIWNGQRCTRQILFEERKFLVDFTPGSWRWTSQAEHSKDTSAPLFSRERYDLYFGEKDRSRLLVFDREDGGELLVPTLEFYSRYFGRSGHVLRVLATYPWEEACDRLFLPHEHPPQPGEWAIKLASRAYNADALFLAHVLHDPYALAAAKGVYAELENQFAPGGKAFPNITPWFKGPGWLIVEGVEVSKNRFLALRIVGGSDPQGPNIAVERENPGRADQPAPADAPSSGWGGAQVRQSDAPKIVNLTSDDAPDHSGNIEEIRNPGFRVYGPKREILRRKLASAQTRPGPREDSVVPSGQHSPGERYGSARGVGVASIHTEVTLESEGATRDVWNALQYLHETRPQDVQAVGWYSAKSAQVQFSREPCMASLRPFAQEEIASVDPKVSRWLFIDKEQTRLRGVLVCYVQTPAGGIFIFEAERRRGGERVNPSTPVDKEQRCGLAVQAPRNLPPKDWIPQVLDGIRRTCAIMSRVIRFCPEGALASDYKRSKSGADRVAGHSTVITALSKMGVELPRPTAAAAAGPGKRRNKSRGDGA